MVIGRRAFLGSALVVGLFAVWLWFGARVPWPTEADLVTVSGRAEAATFFTGKHCNLIGHVEGFAPDVQAPCSMANFDRLRRAFEQGETVSLRVEAPRG